MSQPNPESAARFEALGGAGAIERIVDRFYSGVADDSLLRPLYPADLGESKRTLTLFLIQYFGGPPAYSQERGHPRLRIRHAPFAIGPAERDAWMNHMRAAVAAEHLLPPAHEFVMNYFERAATFMMNR